MKILWYRLLDSLQSLWNRKRKEVRLKRRWGARWRDMTRSGRRYTRVIEGNPAHEPHWASRAEPGWEWTCQNCKSYSIITESMMPDIIAAWAADSKRMTDRAAAKGVKWKIPSKPTAATAGCHYCKYLPGAPE